MSRAAHRHARTDVHPDTALHMRDTARLVDVREPHEYAAGHIHGAELVPLATVEATARDWNREQDVVLICRSGARSGRAADLLVSLGFLRVHNMIGGMIAYAAAGLPVTR
jgi:sulfur-carrier protein adenylyltransferase/sulfurtransferase